MYLISILIISVSCSSSINFQKSQQAYYSGDYKTAQSEIDLALKNFPDDSLLSQFRNIITAKQLELQYPNINHFDLDSRNRNLRKRNKLLIKNNSQDSLKKSLFILYKKESSNLQSDCELYDSLFIKYKQYRNGSEFTSLLKHLASLKPYRVYSIKVEKEFIALKERFSEIKKQMDEEYIRNDFTNLELNISLLDSIYKEEMQTV